MAQVLAAFRIFCHFRPMFGAVFVAQCLGPSIQPLTNRMRHMLRQLLSITQTAERLRVKPSYVRTLVNKKRLNFIHGEQLDAAEVEKLAKLMEKLRSNGIATLVQIVEEGGDPPLP